MSTVNKSHATMPPARARSNSGHHWPQRRRAGPIPARFRIAHTVLGTTRKPQTDKLPVDTPTPQVGFEKTRRLAHGFRNFDNYRLRILLVAEGSRPYRQRPNHAQ
ncbi:MAG: hypothetical protein DLM58_00595 [Pseudonocardiales bacterium]|nr:MAG: hypothetical protein DLM58_00595 [Pseudonocardiales bacterium]